jgi:hypothetical protein
MKKLLVLVFLAISSLNTLSEVIYDFDSVKTFYALFYPDKYFVKDYLIIDHDRTVSITSDLGEDDFFYYHGILEYQKKNATVIALRDVAKFKIPAWYCTLSGTAFWRTHINFTMTPFSYNARDEFMRTLLFILWLPTLLYYLYLIFKK